MQLRRIVIAALLSAALAISTGQVQAQRVVSIPAGVDGGPISTCLGDTRNSGSRICQGGIFVGAPFVSQDYFEGYAGDFSVGNNVAFSFGDNSSNLYSELVGANIHLGRLGYARAGFGALVAASDDSTASTADQFFDGGGNASFFLALPMFYRFTGVKDSDSNSFISRRWDLYLVGSVGADLPELNTAATERAALFQIGPQLTFVQNATSEALKIFAEASGGYSIATSEFYDNVGVDDGDESDYGFAYGQATIGVDLNNLIRVGASIGTSTVDGLSRPFQLSVRLLPQAK